MLIISKCLHWNYFRHFKSLSSQNFLLYILVAEVNKLTPRLWYACFNSTHSYFQGSSVDLHHGTPPYFEQLTSIATWLRTVGSNKFATSFLLSNLILACNCSNWPFFFFVFYFLFETLAEGCLSRSIFALRDGSATKCLVVPLWCFLGGKSACNEPKVVMECERGCWM
mgnify:CR=1 FL=1